MCNMLAPVLELADSEFGGTYWPPSRKDLIFVMRKREEAEGERRMIGSGRRGFFCIERDWLPGTEAGICDDFLENRDENLRTCEKS